MFTGFLIFLTIPVYYLAGIPGVIVQFCLILVSDFFLKKRSLEMTEYRFYEDKVEYFEGFLVRNRKTISYDKFGNLGQREGILERTFGLGTIFIDTAGQSSGHSLFYKILLGSSNRKEREHEVSMNYIKSPNEIYDQLSRKIS